MHKNFLSCSEVFALPKIYVGIMLTYLSLPVLSSGIWESFFSLYFLFQQCGQKNLQFRGGPLNSMSVLMQFSKKDLWRNSGLGGLPDPSTFHAYKDHIGRWWQCRNTWTASKVCLAICKAFGQTEGHRVTFKVSFLLFLGSVIVGVLSLWVGSWERLRSVLRRRHRCILNVVVRVRLACFFQREIQVIL